MLAQCHVAAFAAPASSVGGQKADRTDAAPQLTEQSAALAHRKPRRISCVPHASLFPAVRRDSSAVSTPSARSTISAYVASSRVGSGPDGVGFASLKWLKRAF